MTSRKHYQLQSRLSIITCDFLSYFWSFVVQNEALSFLFVHYSFVTHAVKQIPLSIPFDSAVLCRRRLKIQTQRAPERENERDREGERDRERGDRVVRTANMDAMGVMSIGKQAVALSSGICGTPVKQSVVPAATKSGSVSFAVRATGYDEELVKTAVCVFVLLLPACVRCSDRMFLEGL